MRGGNGGTLLGYYRGQTLADHESPAAIIRNATVYFAPRLIAIHRRGA
jgi:hypothetical protein